MKKILLASAFSILWAPSSWAQGIVCGSYEEVFGKLEAEYGEEPVSVGLTQLGGILYILTNESGATWSAVVVTPDRKACLVASGKDWEHFGFPAKKEEL